MGSARTSASCIYTAVTDEYLPFLRRLALAWGLFLRIVLNGRKAAEFAGRLSDGNSSQPAPPAPDLPAAVNYPNNGDAAIILLSLLQQEGRLVDFLQQELTGFEDAEIGGVARSVHEGCRKVLRSYMTIEPIRQEEEGASLTLQPGFDSKRFKLTGSVPGAGQVQGVLRHRGWIASEVSLPQAQNASAAMIVCPAELEL